LQDFTNKNLAIVWGLAAIPAGWQELGGLPGAVRAAWRGGQAVAMTGCRPAQLTGIRVRCGDEGPPSKLSLCYAGLAGGLKLRQEQKKAGCR